MPVKKQWYLFVNEKWNILILTTKRLCTKTVSKAVGNDYISVIVLFILNVKTSSDKRQMKDCEQCSDRQRK